MPPRGLEITSPRTREEAEAFGWIVVHSLSPVAQPTLGQVESYVDRTGPSRMRIASADGEVLGGLVLLATGQFFGGLSVPMTGVSAVAVTAHHRGRGIARELLVSALREMEAARVGMSVLHASTQVPYRNLGWELSGVRNTWRVPTRALALGVSTPPVRPMLSEDRASLHSCWFEWARQRPGMVERTDWFWKRVLESPDAEVRVHVVDSPRGRGIEGYVVATREPLQGWVTELHVRELVALTPGAQASLMSFLGSHRSIARTTLLPLSRCDPAFALMAEAEQELVRERLLMSRIVHLETAMSTRGCVPGLATELVVEVEDEFLPSNAGRWTIGCRDGTCFARRVRSRPEASLHVRGLAPLFTGHASPREVEAAGLVSGSTSALERLAALFAGPQPWTVDTW